MMKQSTLANEREVNAAYRREGSCPLHYNRIRQILEYIHDDLRFIINRYGLGNSGDIIPVKLSIHAIINANLMDHFKGVLMSKTFKERMWSIVDRSSARSDSNVTSWLRALIPTTINDNNTIMAASKYQYSNGGSYQGDWIKQGHGKLIYANGNVYDGDFRDDKKHGQGKYTYANGVVYEGGWRDDKFCDQGKLTFFDNDGTYIYEGNFKDGYYHGHGMLKYPGNGFYEGNWIKCKEHGHGKIKYNNGNVYEGDWLNGKKHGQGKLTYADGRVYIGDFKNDKQSGNGKQTWPDGKVYEGGWDNDSMHGKGVLHI